MSGPVDMQHTDYMAALTFTLQTLRCHASRCLWAPSITCLAFTCQDNPPEPVKHPSLSAEHWSSTATADPWQPRGAVGICAPTHWAHLSWKPNTLQDLPIGVKHDIHQECSNSGKGVWIQAGDAEHITWTGKRMNDRPLN